MTDILPADDRALVDALVQLTFAIQAVLQRVAAAHDVSMIQLRLLGILRDHEPGMRELARYLNLDKSSVSGLVDRAEQRGLMRREPSPDDGRALRVVATPLGRELIEAGAAEIEREVFGLTAGLSEADRRQLLTLIVRILAG